MLAARLGDRTGSGLVLRLWRPLLHDVAGSLTAACRLVLVSMLCSADVGAGTRRSPAASYARLGGSRRTSHFCEGLMAGRGPLCSGCARTVRSRCHSLLALRLWATEGPRHHAARSADVRSVLRGRFRMRVSEECARVSRGGGSGQEGSDLELALLGSATGRTRPAPDLRCVAATLTKARTPRRQRRH